MLRGRDISPAPPVADLRSSENCHLQVEVGGFIVLGFRIHFLPPNFSACSFPLVFV
jgi:hypothetical protein